MRNNDVGGLGLLPFSMPNLLGISPVDAAVFRRLQLPWLLPQSKSGTHGGLIKHGTLYFITGGVVSSLGKRSCLCGFGALLASAWFVRLRKLERLT